MSSKLFERIFICWVAFFTGWDLTWTIIYIASRDWANVVVDGGCFLLMLSVIWSTWGRKAVRH